MTPSPKIVSPPAPAAPCCVPVVAWLGGCPAGGGGDGVTVEQVQQMIQAALAGLASQYVPYAYIGSPDGVAPLDNLGNLSGTIRIRRIESPAAEAVTVLDDGEWGLSADTRNVAIGDGVTTFANLPKVQFGAP